MTTRITLFVLDTGPLITLAAAGSLDYLLYVDGAALVIPDAVFYEAAHDASRLGAADILAWIREHRATVEIAQTNAYLTFDAARTLGLSQRQPNLGEIAAVEVIEDGTRLRHGEKAILLCEESAVLRRVTVRDRDRIVELSTMDYLRLLEAEQRIQSAEAVFQMAELRGRTPSRVEKADTHAQDVRDAIRDLVRRP